MGWDIDLKHPVTGKPAEVEPFLYGSKVLLGCAIVSEKDDGKGGRRVGLGGELWLRAGADILPGFAEKFLAVQAARELLRSGASS